MLFILVSILASLSFINISLGTPGMFLKYLLISGYFAISLYDALSLGFYLSKLSRIYYKYSGYYSSIFPLKPDNIFFLTSFSLPKKACLPVKR
jgi:hypothetical protein